MVASAEQPPSLLEAAHHQRRRRGRGRNQIIYHTAYPTTTNTTTTRQRSIRYLPQRWNAHYLHIITIFFLFTLSMFREKHFGRSKQKNKTGLLFFLSSNNNNHDNKGQTYPLNLEQKPNNNNYNYSSNNKDENNVTKKDELTDDVLNNGWIPKIDVIRHDQKHQVNGKLQHKLNLYLRKQNNKESGSLKSDLEYQPSLDNYPLNLLQNVSTPLQSSDLLLIWHIPKAAGTSLKAILERCFGLRRVENVYAHMETTTIAGISHAKAMNLQSWDTIDFIVSSRLHEASTLLSQQHKGRMYALLRHPIDTALSLFRYLGYATWEPHYNASFANMTLQEYTSSGQIMDNWMTRYLSRHIKGTLNSTHLQLAKDILREKCFIGLLSDLDESMAQMQQYYGLTRNNNLCANHTQLLHINSYSNHKKYNTTTIPEKRYSSKDDETWKLLAPHLEFDLQIFEYAQYLYHEVQPKLISSSSIRIKRKWNYRRRKEPCANYTPGTKCQHFPQ